MSQNLHSIQPQPRATVPAVTEVAPIYYGILTDQGQALLATAIASGTPLPLTAMAAGDGGGQPVTPLAEMTELVNEVHRAPLNQLFVDPTAPNQIVAEMVMAEIVGGFWIRELGLFAESGELFAVCNTPDSYKPVLAEGAGRSLLTRMILIVSDTAAVELIINPDTVMASRAYVDAKLAEHAASRDHPAAIEGAQGMIQLATQAMVDEGTDHTSAVTPQTASITFARKAHSHTPQEAGAAPLEHEHEIEDVLWLQEALDEKAEVGHTHTPAEAGALPVGSYNPRADAMNNEGGTVTQFIGDLNTLTMGTYVLAKGAGSTNYPDATAGYMYVETRSIYSADALLQVAWPYEADSAVWFRNYSTNSDSWLPWVKIYDTAHKPTAADVGAMPKSGGAFDAGARVTFSGSYNGPDDVALNMGNQSIGGVHGIVFNDSSGSHDEALLWPKTGITGADPDVGDYDSFRVIDGVVYINANKMYHQGFEQPHTIGTPTELGANVDLDTIKTPGVYCQTANAEASTALHYPEANAGSLVVYQAAGPVQQYFVYNSSRVYVRAQYSTGGWTAWAKQYNTQNKPTAADVEAMPSSGIAWNDTAVAVSGSTGTIAMEAGAGGTYISIDMLYQAITFTSATRTATFPGVVRAASAPYQGDDLTNKVYVDSKTWTAAQGNADIVAGGYGQVGSYVLAWNVDGQSVFIGNTKPGSGLIPATAGERRADDHFLSGTYKCMGHVFGGGNSDDATTLWIRTDAASLFEQQFMLSELAWDNAEHDSATAIATFANSGVSLPFTASRDDVEAHGRWLFAMARDGEFGPIAEYVPPTDLEVATRDNPKTRQKELAYAIAQAQHWEMMGIPEQANAWRDYYQALYALEATPDWPQISQWPIPPEA